MGNSRDYMLVRYLVSFVYHHSVIRENLETNSFTHRACNAIPHASEFLKGLYPI